MTLPPLRWWPSIATGWGCLCWEQRPLQPSVRTWVSDRHRASQGKAVVQYRTHTAGAGTGSTASTVLWIATQGPRGQRPARWNMSSEARKTCGLAASTGTYSPSVLLPTALQHSANYTLRSVQRLGWRKRVGDHRTAIARCHKLK